MDLLQTDDNKTVIIREILGDEESDKLAKFGLHRGVEIQKISGNPLSDVITIGIDDRYFAITNTMAKKVLTEYVCTDSH